MKYYFNWNQLKMDAGSKYEGILVLLNASLIGYNNKIANNGNQLMAKLHLHNIPVRVFQRKFLFVKKQGIYSSYTCKDPQSYFTNKDFITTTHTTAQKIKYLYMLAQRPISVEDIFIPKYYVPERLWNNPFIEIDDKHINFITERS